jgi:hypothetical protein
MKRSAPSCLLLAFLLLTSPLWLALGLAAAVIGLPIWGLYLALTAK